MKKIISFEDQLDKLRDSGFSEEQVKAIWRLVVDVACAIAEVGVKHE